MNRYMHVAYYPLHGVAVVGLEDTSKVWPLQELNNLRNSFPVTSCDFTISINSSYSSICFIMNYVDFKTCYSPTANFPYVCHKSPLYLLRAGGKPCIVVDYYSDDTRLCNTLLATKIHFRAINLGK